MNPNQASQLTELAKLLVSPERYQKIAQIALEAPTATVFHFPTPELARIYNFPSLDEYDQG